MTLTGKTALVTGATSGIGQWTVLGLMNQGARVLAPVRDQERGRQLERWVKEKKTPGKLELMSVDLSSLESVRRLVSDVHERTSALDLLINNAGVFYSHQANTVDGIDQTLAVNYLAPFMLMQGCVDLLTASGQARVVNVSSDAEKWVKKLDPNDLQ